MPKLRHALFNLSIALNSLLLFLVAFESSVQTPTLLQVVGRLHPLVLHFPIALMTIAIVWEVFVLTPTHDERIAIGDWLLLITTLTATIAALTGFMLSLEDGYDADAITFHKWTGIAVSFISLLWYSLRHYTRRFKTVSAVAGATCVVAITLAGHQGATITHGENFLLEPVSALASNHSVLIDDALAYEHVVKPILEAKCFSCHSSKKAKGELVMETEALLRKGGKSGKLWDSAKTRDGLLMTRIHLPEEAEKHMPPKGKPQLTAEEINVIDLWIKRGADFEKRMIDLPVGDTLRLAAAPFLKTIEGDSYTFAPADETLVQKRSTDYCVVQPIALNSPALNVEFFGASFFNSDQLRDLQPLKEQIVSLSLLRMPAKDADIKTIASFTNLRKLNLSFTDITGATLNELNSLEELRDLALSGTQVTAKQLKALTGLRKLSTLFLWNTSLSDADLALLNKQWKNIRIESGFDGKDLLTKLTPPLIEGDEQVFSDKVKVQLKHFIKGAELRYTIDGTEPDSITSAIYDASEISINKSTTLKTKAYLKGWVSSDVSSKSYYKSGLVPDSVHLATAPHLQYKGRGSETPFDLRLGTTNFATPNWLGYKEVSFKEYAFFNKPTEVSSVMFRCLVDIGSYIFPATKFEVWSENEAGKMTLLGTVKPEAPTVSVLPYLTTYNCQFKPTKTKRLLLVGHPVSKLPTWHPGKGERGWFFVDEIFLN